MERLAPGAAEESGIVAQTKADWNGDGRSDLLFFDLQKKRIRIGEESVGLPKWLQGEIAPLYFAGFPGDSRVDVLAGRLGDTYYKVGKRIEDVQEYNPWGWTYRDSGNGQWQPEYMRWVWDWDTPLVADLNHDGLAHHIAYRHRTKEWLAAPDGKLAGPVLEEAELPLPIAGRFLNGSIADLGLWSLKSGTVSLRSLSSGQSVSLKWGGRPDDVLVAGDYNGDGYDEIAVWQRNTRTWFWRHAPDGPISQAVFGTDTGIPAPFDYNHDRRLDLAYWEPVEGKIFVSFTLGRLVDLIIPVPPNSVPAFVNMY